MARKRYTYNMLSELQPTQGCALEMNTEDFCLRTAMSRGLQDQGVSQLAAKRLHDKLRMPMVARLIGQQVYANLIVGVDALCIQ